MTISAKKILKQLDSAAKEFNFPVLDNLYTELAGCRLTVYFNRSRWAIVIEVVGFTARYEGSEAFSTKIYWYGSAFKKNPGFAADRMLFPIASGASGNLLDESLWLNTTISDVVIRGRRMDVLLNDSFFSDASVSPAYHPQIHGAEFLRVMWHRERDLLLATDSELRQKDIIRLPQMLQLASWQHPDVAGDELPSQTRSFQMIAEAIAAQNPALYKPEEVVANNSWQHWNHLRG